MECTKNIDWDLLNKQKQTLLELICGGLFDEEHYEDMDGILNLLDAMTDENYHTNN